MEMKQVVSDMSDFFKKSIIKYFTNKKYKKSFSKKQQNPYKIQENSILIQKSTGNQTGSETGSEPEIIRKLIGNQANSDFGYRSLK